MPKLKTRKGIAKRFRVTGSGKIMRRRAFKGHLMLGKSPSQKRRLSSPAEVTGGYAAEVRRNLPYA
ncbi:MAG: 50S ribosomal protein L35 [Armatimonadetes bacterium]|jgi:large subunit ribosomal protein L35|nr:50S ribosomal protein L35 [Armatimonadota bacterium]